MLPFKCDLKKFMLVTHQERPRELRWYHAGPMLYGDWGTSRFYVLGLAFYYSLHASFYYVLGVCGLVAAVGWAYTIICRCYPDGGGVYSAARQTSKTLAVIGALLLFADYIITASLSAIEGMHYFGISDQWVPIFAISVIVFVGIMNYIGPRSAGTFALIVAVGTLIFTLVLLAFCIPHLSAGWAAIHKPTEPLGHQWRMLVNVVLALSGVEAVANMTGIMTEPVGKTSKKTIWPVLCEVVILNLVFAVAMNALPSIPGVNIGNRPAYEKDEQRIALKESAIKHHDTAAAEAIEKSGTRPTKDEENVKNAVLRFMGEKYVGKAFGAIAGIVFGLLLLSAVNTAVGGMISIQYVMSHDGEVPKWFTKLNSFGVPWVALLPAVIIPAGILFFVHDLEQLADLYAIGVVGAISINLTSCTINRKLPVKIWERAGLGILAAIMIAIEITLSYQKPHALIFAGSILVAGLGLRHLAKAFPEMRKTVRDLKNKPVYRGIKVGEQEAAAATATAEAAAIAAPVLDMSKPTLMVATRGGSKLLDFAASYAHDINANLFVLFVRQIRVAGTPIMSMALEDDPEAQRILENAKKVGAAKGVSVMPIYVVSADVAYSILDFAATYNARALLMGVSRKATLLRALQGDVLTTVADQLPEDIPLLIHA